MKALKNIFVRRCLLVLTFMTILLRSHHSFAQSYIQDAQTNSFKELFVVAGYSAAFGAAMGAALLPFMAEPPMSHMRFITAGASVGFIAGSVFQIFTIYNDNKLYRTNHENDDFYYNVPPTAVHMEGAHIDPKTLERTKRNKYIEPLPQDALFVGQGSQIALAFPALSIAPKYFALKLAYFKF